MNERALVGIAKAILAVLGSAVLASLVLVFSFVAIQGPLRSTGGAVDGLLSLLFFATLISTPFVAAGMLLIGLPADLMLTHSGVRHPAAYAASGAVGGLVVALLLSLTFGLGPGPWFLTPICAGYGLVTGSVYWSLFPRMRATD